MFEGSIGLDFRSNINQRLWLWMIMIYIYIYIFQLVDLWDFNLLKQTGNTLVPFYPLRWKRRRAKWPPYSVTRRSSSHTHDPTRGQMGQLIHKDIELRTVTEQDWYIYMDVNREQASEWITGRLPGERLKGSRWRYEITTNPATNWASMEKMSNQMSNSEILESINWDILNILQANGYMNYVEWWVLGRTR